MITSARPAWLGDFCRFLPLCVAPEAERRQGARRVGRAPARLLLVGSIVVFRAARAALVLTLAVAVGCDRSPSAPDMKSARSWTATAIMVGEAWLEGRVPARYAVRTLATASQSVGARAESNGAETTARVIERIRAAIDRGDADGVRHAITELRR